MFTAGSDIRVSRSLQNSLKAIGLLGLACLLLLCGSAAFAISNWSYLYRNQFAFLPGSWFASQLRAVGEPSRTCIFLGTSVVREGFDSAQLSSEVRGIEFVNLATTGGLSPMDVIDIQSSILGQSGARYRCIILGLDNFYVRAFTPEAYDLISTNYISQLSINSVFSLQEVLPRATNKKDLLARMIMPFGKHALQAQRWWRYGIYRGRQMLSSDIPKSSYELFQGEFTPAVQYMYDNLPSAFEVGKARAAETIKRYALDSSSSYEAKGPAVALRNSIRRLSKLTDHLILVRMPLSSAYDRVEEVALPFFKRAIQADSYSKFVDCNVPLEEEAKLYFDAAHLNRAGREKLSSAIGQIIAPVISGMELSDNMLMCMVSEP